MNRENMTKRTGMTGKIGITERNDWEDYRITGMTAIPWYSSQGTDRPVTNCNRRFFSFGIRKIL